MWKRLKNLLCVLKARLNNMNSRQALAISEEDTRENLLVKRVSEREYVSAPRGPLTTIGNGVVLGAGMVASILLTILVFALLDMFYLGHTLAEIMEMWAPPFVIGSLEATVIYLGGEAFRASDNLLIMRNCKLAARRKMSDPGLFHEEDCKLLAEEVNEELGSKLRKFQERLAIVGRLRSRNEFICVRIRNALNLSSESRDAALVKPLADIEALNKEFRQVVTEIGRVKSQLRKSLAEIAKSNIMAHLPAIASQVEEVLLGESRIEFEVLKKGTRDDLDRIGRMAQEHGDMFLIANGLVDPLTKQ